MIDRMKLLQALSEEFEDISGKLCDLVEQETHAVEEQREDLDAQVKQLRVALQRVLDENAVLEKQLKKQQEAHRLDLKLQRDLSLDLEAAKESLRAVRDQSEALAQCRSALRDVTASWDRGMKKFSQTDDPDDLYIHSQMIAKAKALITPKNIPTQHEEAA